MSIQNRAMRFVIRNKNTYYISEKLMTVSATHTLSSFSNSTETDKKWAVFDPTLLQMPNPLPTFTAVDFDDVQEVGIIYEGSRSAYGHSFMMTNFSVNGLVNPEYILPVELIDFQGIKTEEGNFLSWKIADTKTVDNIEIEKSNDGKIFTPLSILSKNDHSFLDKNPQPITLYRLKINEIDGNFHYSKTISLTNESLKKVKIRLDTEGVLFVENEAHEASNLFVFNSIGQLVFSKNNLSEVEKIILSDLPMGLYIVEIRTAKRRDSVKILKRS
jgi:hypothetical protein